MTANVRDGNDEEAVFEPVEDDRVGKPLEQRATAPQSGIRRVKRIDEVGAEPPIELASRG